MDFRCLAIVTAQNAICRRRRRGVEVTEPARADAFFYCLFLRLCRTPYLYTVRNSCVKCLWAKLALFHYKYIIALAFFMKIFINVKRFQDNLQRFVLSAARSHSLLIFGCRPGPPQTMPHSTKKISQCFLASYNCK